MRGMLVVVMLGGACDGGSPGATPDAEPVEVVPVAAAPVVAPAAPVVVPPVVAPEVPAPAPVLALQLGPERYQFPATLRCDDHEPGPFCGVHILDVASRQTTTLVSRDGKTWAVREGKVETPTVVEFIEVPRAAELLQRVEPMMRLGAGSFVSVMPQHPALPEPFMLPEVRTLLGDFVLLGEKLYVRGYAEKGGLFEIDPKSRSARLVEFAGKDAIAVLPGGPNLALYLEGKKRRSVGLYDVAAQAFTVELEIPRPLESECRRTRHYYGEDEVAFVPASGRFYVGFSCVPDA